jgi:hypothetical protein
MNQRTKEILIQIAPWMFVLLLSALLIMQWRTIARLQSRIALGQLEREARRELRPATKVNQERRRFSLLRSENGRIVLQQRKPDGTDKDFFGGVFTSIGVGDNHIFMRIPARDGEREGWRIIDLRSGAVNGPDEDDAEFMSRPEVTRVRLMTPAEAWTACEMKLPRP